MSTVYMTVYDNVNPKDYKLEVGTGTGGVKLEIISLDGSVVKFWLNREKAEAVGEMIYDLAEKGGS